jgi:hypothetical protein
MLHPYNTTWKEIFVAYRAANHPLEIVDIAEDLRQGDPLVEHTPRRERVPHESERPGRAASQLVYSRRLVLTSAERLKIN